jgi:membrane protease YdiL (CAAX protease family)
MAGIIVQLIISWLLVWVVERKNLGVLGLLPTEKRVLDFALFFAITCICCTSGFFMKMIIANQQWQINPALSFSLVAEGVRWNIISVLFEELIFRGVLLYILVKRIGATKAILISAVAFGIYHWFSFQVFGNPVQMAFVFVITGSMGLVLAYAYAKTLSLYLPVGIHFGWNLTQNFIFSDGPIGNGIFIQANPQPFRTDSYLIFISVTFLPLVLALLINFLLVRKNAQFDAFSCGNNIRPNLNQLS